MKNKYMILILLGNKTDKSIREVSEKEARDFAKTNGLEYFETSAALQGS